MLRYDNERGKGDHRHIEGREEQIDFTGLRDLLRAFKADMERIIS
ncbi:toxin-antitoxin system TumE family protein [Agrobacterium sp. 22094]